MKPQRPGGVTAISILAVLGGVLSIFGGGATLIVTTNPSTDLTRTAASAGLTTPLGILLLVLGIAQIAFAVGLFRMAVWGFWGIIVLEIVGIALTLLQGSFTGLVIPIIVVIYLFQKRELFTGAPSSGM